MSLRDKIRDSDDLPSELLSVPEWEVDVLIKGMNGQQRVAFIQDFSNGEGKIDFAKLYPELIMAGTFDPDNPAELVFEEDDRGWLMSKSGSSLERIARKVMDLSGMGEDAKDEAGKSS